MDAAKRSIIGYQVSDNRGVGPCILAMRFLNSILPRSSDRPFKQMIERLNRTYKASYRSTNGFDNIDANYDLALWVAYYNFLRPYKHAGNQVLNEADLLKGADNMPGKWQLLIFLGQQTILNLQNQTATT